MPRLARIGLAAAGALALIGIGAAIAESGGSSGSGASPRPAVTVTAPPATVTIPVAPIATATITKRIRPRPAKHTFMNQDGVYVVGSDILPGTYHTTGGNGTNSSGCYYALLSSTNTSDIIDNNIVNGPATITVGSGVAAVDVEGCNTWHKI